MVAQVALFTTTFYGNDEGSKVRKELARTFIRRGVERDYPVFVVDGGTDDGKFIDELNGLGARAFRETQRGLGPSRREALEHAYRWARTNNVPYICWSEPEKVDFVGSIGELVDVAGSQDVKLIVPARRSLESYPEAQQWSEKFGNQLHTDAGYVDCHREPLDTFFGPKIWDTKMTPFFQVFGTQSERVARALGEMRYEKMKKSYNEAGISSLAEHEKAVRDLVRTDHIQHMPVCLMALKHETIFGKSLKIRDFPIFSHTIDYEHPAEQTELETRMQPIYNGKRLMQLGALAEQFELVRKLHDGCVLDDSLDRMLGEAA